MAGLGAGGAAARHRRPLDDGTLTSPKARAVAETFEYLTDADAAGAEALIVDQLAGKTYTQVLRLAEQAALTVDPGLAERRREQAQKKDARVSFFREQAGTAGLSGRDLPPDEALAAMAERQRPRRGVRGIGRVRRHPDGRAARLRLPRPHQRHPGRGADRVRRTDRTTPPTPRWHGQPHARAGQAEPSPRPTTPIRPGRSGRARTTDVPGCDGSCEPMTTRCDDPDERPMTATATAMTATPVAEAMPAVRTAPAVAVPAVPAPAARTRRRWRSRPGPGVPPQARARQRRPADLIVPLTTLLGLAERPGEIHGFGLLDPALARELAAAAAASPRTEVCVTVTSPEGYAIGHGCARPARTVTPGPARQRPRRASRPAEPDRSPPPRSPGLLPVWLVTLAPGPSPRRTPRGRPGTPDGFGTWTLALPGGRELTVRLDPVPIFECDHRYETHGYQPSDQLRHLVQIRDGTCTFPPCNRHARESDFEHALPYDQGGKTCTCNAGARSRACHRVKQSPGWNVTQPKPGWHRWQTPAGRVYVQEPKRYPA